MTGSASRFLDLLRRLNRKERFYLIGHALGNSRFQLSDDFRHQLADEIGVSVPENAFVAMDYHLNWIYAAAHLSSDPALLEGAACVNPLLNENLDLRIVQGNQEDIDLVVAFARGDKAQMLLVEAKGVTGWDNKQLASKAKRLESIFGPKGDKFGHIDPHFAIVSPTQSHALQTKGWPSWMLGEKVAWLEMTVPDDLLVVTRCDGKGRVSRFGDHWKAAPERTFKVQTADAEAG